MWTASQRRVVLVIAVGLLVSLSIRVALRHTYIPDPQPPEGLRAAELADKLDPNTAALAEIAAIPNVGEKLAEAVVSYRQARLKDYPDRPAFAEPMDLLRVRGIGVARMEAMQAYLVFPVSVPTTTRVKR
jgi:DNA uptake protein ComE-like DNA-binding protein